ncbi:MAG: von Willebrand factor type A domain-containing protein [Kiritimatiellae bacterium]|nr:von Willebrand factor type A domain-containing protein [Kiritimatiellia bacterium]
MNCDETQEQLTSYLLGDLTEAQAAQVRAHLAECERCRAATAETESTLNLLKAALAGTSNAPQELLDRQRMRILASRERRALRWYGHKLGMAAAFLICLGGLAIGGIVIAMFMPVFQMHEVCSFGGDGDVAAQVMEHAEDFGSRLPAGEVQIVGEPGAQERRASENFQAFNDLSWLSGFGNRDASLVNGKAVRAGVCVNGVSAPEKALASGEANVAGDTVRVPSLTALGRAGSGEGDAYTFYYGGAAGERGEKTRRERIAKEIQLERQLQARDAQVAQLEEQLEFQREELQTVMKDIARLTPVERYPAVPAPPTTGTSEEKPTQPLGNVPLIGKYAFRQNTDGTADEWEGPADAPREDIADATELDVLSSKSPLVMKGLYGGRLSAESRRKIVDQYAGAKRAEETSGAVDRFSSTHGAAGAGERTVKLGALAAADKSGDLEFPADDVRIELPAGPPEGWGADADTSVRAGGASGPALDPGKLTTRTYPVQPTFGDLLRQQAESQDADGAADPFAGLGVVRMGREIEEHKLGDTTEIFRKMGAALPPGSSVDYDREAGTITVQSTPENIESFEGFLQPLGGGAAEPASGPVVANEVMTRSEASRPDESTTEQNMITCTLDDVPLQDVVRMFTRISGANIISAPEVLKDKGNVTVNLEDIEWKPTLSAILDMKGLALVEKPPNSGVYSIVERKPGMPEPFGDESAGSYSLLANKRRLRERLDNIIIPSFEFRQANVHDVIEFLQKSSQMYDPEPDPEKKGVNFVLNLNLPGGEAPMVDVPHVTLALNRISLLDAVKYITEVTGLKYKIEENVIQIVPAGVVSGETVTRMYPVDPRLAELLKKTGVQKKGKTSAGQDVVPATVDVADFFKRMGVPFPIGTSVTYVEPLGKLAVANTPENTEILEEVLSQISVASKDMQTEQAGGPETTQPAVEPDPAEEQPAAAKPEKAKEEPAPEPEPQPLGVVKRAFGVNPFHTTKDQPLSTFAIDVDTAAYTLARNTMQRGQLPPPEAVRTEEFVNAFDYAYTPPVGETFRVYTEYAPTPFGRGLHLLKIGVKGRRLGREEQRKAVLTLLIDSSGSMATPDRLGLIRQALRMLAGKLAPHDRIAIVLFANRARLALEHTDLAQKDRILAVIDAIQCSGSTNLEEGMKLAYRTAVQGFVAGAENRVLILSDGVANLGTAAADDILKQVAANRRQGIYCSVFGFGYGTYNDAMLETLANKGDGVYAFIDSADEAKRVFVDELSATINVIAADVKVQVEFNPARVKRYRQLGYENRQLKAEDFRDDTVDAGEVGSGQSVTALYEMELCGRPADPLGTVRVRYRDAATGVVQEIETAISGAGAPQRFENAAPRFRLAAAVAEFSELLRGSPFAAGSSFEAVARVLRPVAMDLALAGKPVQELVALVQSAPGMPQAVE